MSTLRDCVHVLSTLRRCVLTATVIEDLTHGDLISEVEKLQVFGGPGGKRSNWRVTGAINRQRMHFLLLVEEYDREPPSKIGIGDNQRNEKSNMPPTTKRLKIHLILEKRESGEYNARPKIEIYSPAEVKPEEFSFNVHGTVELTAEEITEQVWDVYSKMEKYNIVNYNCKSFANDVCRNFGVRTLVFLMVAVNFVNYSVCVLQHGSYAYWCVYM